jgi:uncharacterized membrane protein (GlpM family)
LAEPIISLYQKCIAGICHIELILGVETYLIVKNIGELKGFKLKQITRLYSIFNGSVRIQAIWSFQAEMALA